MRVRMKARAAGPEQGHVFQPGDVVDVDETTALAWLNGGYAEAVATHDVERATAGAAERAILPGLGAEPVTAVKGIGRGMAARLGEVGIHTVWDLATDEAGPVRLAAGVSAETAQAWIDEAGMLCEPDENEGG